MPSEEVSKFVFDRVHEVRNDTWRKEAIIQNELFGIFERNSLYWGKLIEGDFKAFFVKGIGKKRWVTFRDEVLLRIDYNHYIAIGNIDGQADWKIPPSAVSPK